MSKVLEDRLGGIKYLFMGLIFVGILYLVVKQININKYDSFRRYGRHYGRRGHPYYGPNISLPDVYYVECV